MRRAYIIILLILLSFGLKAQVYQAMPQAGYGPVKRMLFDSVLTIPLNINQLRNISGGRDAGQIRYNVTDSGLYVYSGYQWIKANLDSTNISNRINGKLNISDTMQMLSVYLRKLDTASLSRRIDLRVKYSDTAAMLDPYLRKLDTASLSDRINKKQNAITLTTNFKSGASTLVGATLNIPKYSDTLEANYVPYVGAIKDVDLGEYKLNANTLKADYLLQAKNNPYSITPTSDYTSITPDKTSFVLYTSWMQGQSTYTQSNRFNYANIAQQNNTREYSLPVRNGTLALVEDTVNLSNRINLKADKATILTINGVGYDLSANRTWTIPTVDTTSLSNRINLRVKYSDTASMLSSYLRKADTSSLSNRIDLKLNSADTSSLSNRINLKADKSTTLSINGTSYDLSANRSWTIPVVDTTSLSNRINLKVNISDTAAMLNPYLRKVDTTNAFLTSVSQPNDSTLSFVKGSTLTSYIIRASTQGSAVKLITNVYNNSGATILKGSVVYINGAHSSNLPTIALAISSSESTSAFTYGLVESDIPNNSAGTVVQNGVLNGLNLPTSTYTDGQTLYLSPTVLGGYTTTKVIAPNHYVAIGTVTRAHPTLGTIQVAIRNGFQLDELSDVKIAAVPLDSTVLQFSRVDSLWHDVSITSAIGSKYIKPTDTTSLSNRINAKADALSGTTNTVPKFTSSTTIGNSNIKDNGNAVTINATAGSFGALQVGNYNGNILMNTTNSSAGLTFQNTSSSNKLWDFSSDNNDLVFNESNIAPVMRLKAGGNVVISNLSGTGTRMVVADANGVLSTQAISSDTTSLSNRINTKLNISDTASMLSGYQSAINLRLKISDTASMLSPYLRKVDTASLSNRINTKQGTITLTTIGTSGAATFSSNTLNIPQYQAAGTYVTSVTGTSPIVSSGGTTPAISIPAASSSVNGYLSSTDWSTFNNKGSGSVTSVATGLGLSGGTITTSGTLLVDTSSASILSRQRAANTYATTSSLSGYLPLTGGALTGALSITSASPYALDVVGTARISGNVTLTGTYTDFRQTSYLRFSNTGGGTRWGYIQHDGTNMAFSNDIGGGAFTFNSYVTGTNFYSNGVLTNTNNIGSTPNANYNFIGSGGYWGLRTGASGQFNIDTYNAGTQVNALSITQAGAATFSSSVTAGGLVTINKQNEGLILSAGVNTDASYMSTRANNATGWLIMGSQGSVGNYIQSGTGANESAITTVGAYALALGTNQVERMRITSGGNVGIGTTSPSGKFEIASNANTYANAPAITFTDLIGNANSNRWIVGNIATDYGSFNIASAPTATSTTYTPRITILNGGNVGIGTTSPPDKLTVYQSGVYPSSIGDNVIGAIANDGGAAGTLNQLGFGYSTQSAGQYYPVIIGSVSTSSSGQTKGDFFIATRDATTGTTRPSERMRITSGGEVQINGTTSASGASKLTVRYDGTSNYPITVGNESVSGGLIRFAGNGSGVLGSITHNGTNVAYNTSSDYRLKEDFKEFNGLELISKIKTYDYAWKSNKSRMYGFIAHELQDILPYTVNGKKDEVDEDGNAIYQGVDYSKLTPILIKAVQELSVKNEALIKRIETLENK